MKIPRIFQERNPTQGSLVKTSISMTFPLWINTVFWMIINLLNLFWISQLGEGAIAAVAIGSAAFMILMMPIQGIGTAIYNLIGSFDRQNREGLTGLVKQIMMLVWIVSLLLAIFGYFGAPILLQLLGAEPKVISLSVIYLRICALGGIVSFSFWPILKVIRSTRDMFRPMIFMALVLALQGILDYLFILGNFGFPRMEVAGAALSSVISAAIGTLVGIWALAKGNLFIRIDFKHWQEFKIKTKTLKEVVNLAGFDTTEGLIRTIASMVMMAIVASFGTLALAAFAIGQRFFRYASQFGMDIGETTAIVLSNNLGDKKRAEKSGWINCLINAVVMGVIGLALFIFADWIIGLFSQNPEVLATGAAYLRITTFLGLGYVFFASGTALRRAFAGAGNTLTPLVVYIAMAVIQIVLSLTLPKFGLGINGVWIAILAAAVFYGLALAVLFKIGRWKLKTIN